jgi:hypothetical protein
MPEPSRTHVACINAQPYLEPILRRVRRFTAR